MDVMQPFYDICADPKAYARSWKARTGGKVVGTLCSYAPEELILAAGMLQSICDPTNTANVWIAGFQGVTVNQILRSTVLIVWLAAAVAVVIFAFQFVS